MSRRHLYAIGAYRTFASGERSITLSEPAASLRHRRIPNICLWQKNHDLHHDACLFGLRRAYKLEMI
jgi:hypothetical protein